MITVAICTFNRRESLRRTLASLADMQHENIVWELLVVDNNSKDGTVDVVQSFKKLLPIRYVREEVQGLSAARNRALSQFRGDLLLFTDDDVVVDPSWLRAFEWGARQFPDAGYFGGRVVPFWPNGKPDWLKDESLALISGLLVRFHLGDETRLFTPNEPTPFGASFGLRRRVVQQIGTFRLDLGVSGGVPGRGEESEYLDRVKTAGWSGVYVGRSVAYHWTDPRRLQLGYLYRYGVQTGVAAVRMGSNDSGTFFGATLYALRGVLQLVKGRGDRFRQCVINIGIQMGLRGVRRRAP